MTGAKYSRWFMLVPVLMLALLYVLPIWKISLGIPQYPKEITMRIRIDRLENGSEKAIEILNVLNKSIGMKAIDPAIIPELRIFPWVLGALIAFGLLSVLPAHPLFRIAWAALLLIAALAAMGDFYLWLFDYGHDLSADAPIKLEGSSFQPPLIGTRRVANFTVKSIPLAGAIAATMAIILSWTAVYLEIRKS
jgi:copper chaperone NosL